ncbi:MAG: glycosyltransferase [Chloroflexota bacterium]|nr:glycosyltransferase [Chloroflexota bacterium]
MAAEPGPAHRASGRGGLERGPGLESGGAKAGRGPIRLTIVDDNPFVRASDGQVRPRAATFHRFAEAVVRAGPFGAARYVIPVRDPAGEDADGEGAARLGTVDESLLHIVPSAPFDGAAGYLRRLPRMWRHNLPLLRGTLSGEHLVWIKVPGSNGAAAALVADAVSVARFAYVAGSVSEVVSASPRTGPARIAALSAAALHDGITTVLTRTAPSLRLGPDLFTSAIDAADLQQPAQARDPRDGPWRIVWAGRMAPEKGLATLLRAVTLLLATGREVRLQLIGDGPERPRLEAQARTLGISDSISWEGYVGERERVLAMLRESDLFVLPSLTEGVPKVLVEAMACGVPVIASAVGGIPAVLGDGDRGRLLRPGDEIDLATSIRSLLEDPAAMRTFRDRGVAWAADHTAERQAERLVDWMRFTFPALPWPAR